MNNAKESKMKSTAMWESEPMSAPEMPVELKALEQPVAESDEQNAAKNIDTLKDLTIRLLREVHSISEVHQLSFETGLDFYDEVTRFEIDLIKRALLQTSGHQGRAAKLLNLKVTTLNSKIKHYNINPEAFVSGFRALDAARA